MQLEFVEQEDGEWTLYRIHKSSILDPLITFNPSGFNIKVAFSNNSYTELFCELKEVEEGYECMSGVPVGQIEAVNEIVFGQGSTQITFSLVK